MPRIKRPNRALIAVFGAIIAAVAFAGPASAAYEPAPPTTSVSTQTPAAGGSFMVSGSGFTPGETVTVTLGGTVLGTAVADANGDFSLSVTLPAGVTGAQTIVSTGGTSGLTSSTSITVAAATSTGAATTTGSSTSTGSLAKTGGVVIGIGTLGALFLVGGGMLLVAGRRRKATT